MLDADQDVVNGAAVSIRKREDRVAIWTRTCEAGKVQAVGKRLRALLQCDEKVQIRFQNFSEGATLFTA